MRTQARKSYANLNEWRTAQANRLRSEIRELMAKQGITQAHLSILSGVTRPKICDYLAGRSDMTTAQIHRLTGALGRQMIMVDAEDKPKEGWVRVDLPPRRLVLEDTASA